jgi:hypothetical protein
MRTPLPTSYKTSNVTQKHFIHELNKALIKKIYQEINSKSQQLYEMAFSLFILAPSQLHSRLRDKYGTLKLDAVGTLKRYSKALEYEYRVQTAALGTLKRYSILSLTLYLE